MRASASVSTSVGQQASVVGNGRAHSWQQYSLMDEFVRLHAGAGLGAQHLHAAAATDVTQGLATRPAEAETAAAAEAPAGAGAEGDRRGDGGLARGTAMPGGGSLVEARGAGHSAAEEAERVDVETESAALPYGRPPTSNLRTGASSAMPTFGRGRRGGRGACEISEAPDEARTRGEDAAQCEARDASAAPSVPGVPGAQPQRSLTEPKGNPSGKLLRSFSADEQGLDEQGLDSALECTSGTPTISDTSVAGTPGLGQSQSSDRTDGSPMPPRPLGSRGGGAASRKLPEAGVQQDSPRAPRSGGPSSGRSRLAAGTPTSSARHQTQTPNPRPSHAASRQRSLQGVHGYTGGPRGGGSHGVRRGASMTQDRHGGGPSGGGKHTPAPRGGPLSLHRRTLSMPSALAFFLPGYGALEQAQTQTAGPGRGHGPRPVRASQSLDKRRASSAAPARMRASRSNSTGTSASGTRTRSITASQASMVRGRALSGSSARGAPRSVSGGASDAGTGTSNRAGGGRETAARGDRVGKHRYTSSASLSTSSFNSGARRRAAGGATGAAENTFGPHVRSKSVGRGAERGTQAAGAKVGLLASNHGWAWPWHNSSRLANMGHTSGRPASNKGASRTQRRANSAPRGAVAGPGRRTAGGPGMEVPRGRTASIPRSCSGDSPRSQPQPQSRSQPHSAATTPDKHNRRTPEGSTPDRINLASAEASPCSVSFINSRSIAQEPRAGPPMLAQSRRSQSQGRGAHRPSAGAGAGARAGGVSVHGLYPKEGTQGQSSRLERQGSLGLLGDQLLLKGMLSFGRTHNGAAAQDHGVSPSLNGGGVPIFQACSNGRTDSP